MYLNVNCSNFPRFFYKIFLRCTQGNFAEQNARYRSTFHPGTSSKVIHRCSSFPACILFVLHQVPTHLPTDLFFQSCRGRFVSSLCYFFQISDKFLLPMMDHCFLVQIFFQVFGTCPIPSDNQTSFPSSDPSFLLISIQVSCSFYAPRSFTLLGFLLVQP